jgi:hypothetical protein
VGQVANLRLPIGPCASDQVLELVPEDRRPTLFAHTGHFDLHLTGLRETVFFDV